MKAPVILCGKAYCGDRSLKIENTALISKPSSYLDRMDEQATKETI
jgi:hypothetical protein